MKGDRNARRHSEPSPFAMSETDIRRRAEPEGGGVTPAALPLSCSDVTTGGKSGDHERSNLPLQLAVGLHFCWRQGGCKRDVQSQLRS
jgi:hypothetical protein